MTTTPSWMPPLPTGITSNDLWDRLYSESQMLDYAEQYRKAWMESLKPLVSRSTGSTEATMSEKHVTPTEVLECLRFVRTHLYAAQAQAVPGDDTIITRHVYDAYKRVSDVCREIEINGIGMEIPAMYHINKTPSGIEGPFRNLVAACNRLQAEAEEYQFDDGMGRGAHLDYWHEFDQALERATEALKDE